MSASYKTQSCPISKQKDCVRSFNPRGGATLLIFSFNFFFQRTCYFCCCVFCAKTTVNEKTDTVCSTLLCLQKRLHVFIEFSFFSTTSSCFFNICFSWKLVFFRVCLFIVYQLCVFCYVSSFFSKLVNFLSFLTLLLISEMFFVVLLKINQLIFCLSFMSIVLVCFLSVFVCLFLQSLLVYTHHTLAVTLKHKTHSKCVSKLERRILLCAKLYLFFIVSSP